MKFKQQYSIEKRRNEFIRIKTKYPDRIAIICERDDARGQILPQIDKKKFLIPCDLTVASFIMVLRKRIHLRPECALCLMINGKIFSSLALFSDIYAEDADKGDGFLYCTYCEESTFGGTHTDNNDEI